MATYKVIQDIEAEDKFVGPLTLKQFIFAMAGGLFAYLSFFMVTKGLVWALAITLPPSLFGFFMAVPWSKDQPTDIWVLAKIRFRIKPKVRIWDQAGIQELVTITAPKKIERVLTDNLSQTEVRSRLKILAETIDSRGWAIKHAQFQENNGLSLSTPANDRLVSLDVLPQEVPEDIAPDMLEQQPEIDNMLEQSGKTRKAQLYEKMDRIRQGESLEAIDTNQEIVAPLEEKPLDEQRLSASLKAKKEAGDIAKKNMSSVPIAAPPTTSASATDKGISVKQKTEVEKAQASMTEQSSPDILELARNNDLNVSTIARQANSEKKKSSEEEVVISLH
ncbi:MAG TPA: PrgI family protein [Patescibacteria group bacterium]|nr:PrgI family protein [Patescibacteria group bacterium]